MSQKFLLKKYKAFLAIERTPENVHLKTKNLGGGDKILKCRIPKCRKTLKVQSCWRSLR